MAGITTGRDLIIAITQKVGPSVDVAALHQKYLTRLLRKVNQITNLTHIDPTAAERQMELAQVYTALLTRSSEERDLARLEREQEKPKPVSALEQLNRHQRLVIIGDPGSGKSTFVDFVVMCMAGEMLQGDGSYLDLLCTPLPQEGNRDDKPQPQAWDHGALLPIKVVLRKFAAEGLPPPAAPANAEHLWAYLKTQLESEGLADYAAVLEELFHKQGGLLLFDGLDEVPDPEVRIPQLKQVIEDVAACYQCRVVVTSRPYAYQNPAWYLQDFQQTSLAEFSEGQIRQFISRWYAYLGYMYQWDDDSRQRRAEQLEQAIFSRHRQLMPLAVKPLLLTLMVNLHASKGSLPDKRADLYEETVELLLERWERGRLAADQSVITPRLSDWLEVSQEAIRRLLESLAFEAHQNQPQTVEGTANLDGLTLYSSLMELTDKTIHPQELLDYLDQRAGILESLGKNVYRFPHRTFQEYLAACYLTHQDTFAEETAKLVRQDTNRWREVALLAGARASSGLASAIWLLVDELCAEPVAEADVTKPDLMAALLAGQAIVETANLSQPSKANSRRLKRVTGWLKHITTSDLPVRERATAGQILGQLGDDRSFVGSRNV